MSDTNIRKRCWWHGEFMGNEICPICKEHSQPVKIMMKGNIDEAIKFIKKSGGGRSA